MGRSHEDALVEEIIGDANKKAGRSRRRADREAGQIIEKAEKEAENIHRGSAEAARQRAQKERAVVLATVALGARRIEMEARERLITEVFDSAEKQMLDKQAYDYQSILARLVSAAVHAIGGDGFRIALSKEDRAAASLDAIRTHVCEQLGRDAGLTLEQEPAAIRAGVIVRSADGRRMVDNSFDGRLARMRDDLRRQAARILFGETET